MIPQNDNLVNSSLILYLNNLVLNKGTAYTNWSGRLYKTNSDFSGYYAYSLPFKQIVADQNVTGANLMTGVYLNNNLIGTGTSGFFDINFEQGQVYFTGNVDSQTLSGVYSVKDFNIYLTNEPEEAILFENKYSVRPKINQTVTGLSSNVQTYPAIFVKNQGSRNTPLAFGGQDTTTHNFRLIVMADSLFHLDAVSSIIRDQNNALIPIFQPDEMPFNNYGGYKSGIFNHQTWKNRITDMARFATIERVEVSRFSYNSTITDEIRKLNPGVFPSVIDLEISAARYPRQ